ncbi:sulfatase/phosphatase domain-containing protein, partial [Dysgonomonas sp. UBA7698]
NCNELFDLQNDPTELHNLYGKEGYEEITKELQTTLDNYRKKLKVDEF